MWGWVLIVSALAGLAALAGAMVTSAEMARLLFFVLLAAFLVAIVMGISRRA